MSIWNIIYFEFIIKKTSCNFYIEIKLNDEYDYLAQLH